MWHRVCGKDKANSNQQDLHDGAGLSDATEPNGLESNLVFEVSGTI
jgi:hypothetical protein